MTERDYGAVAPDENSLARIEVPLRATSAVLDTTARDKLLTVLESMG